jgi:hypothetical protein
MEQSSTALPLAWIERIFDRFTTRYGSRFLDMWAALDPNDLKRAWAEELAGLSGEEIKRGLEKCKFLNFPPTLPEFFKLCRTVQKLSPESAFYDAVDQMAKREKGDDTWSHPAIYWTAVRIGAFDLRNNTWQIIKARWTVEFEKVMNNSSWPPIPKAVDLLPKPGQTSISREEAAKRVEEIRKQTGNQNSVSSREWATRILAKHAKGEKVSMIIERFAHEALEVFP